MGLQALLRGGQLPHAEPGWRPASRVLPADLGVPPALGAVQRAMRALRYLEEPRQGGLAHLRAVEGRAGGPAAVARTGPDHPHRRGGPAEALRGRPDRPRHLPRTLRGDPDPWLLAGAVQDRGARAGQAVADHHLARWPRADSQPDPGA